MMNEKMEVINNSGQVLMLPEENENANRDKDLKF